MEVFNNKSYEIKKSDLLKQIAEIESQISEKEGWINFINSPEYEASQESKKIQLLKTQMEICKLKQEINGIQAELRHLDYRKIEFNAKVNPDIYKDEFLKYKYLNDYYAQREDIDFLNLEAEYSELFVKLGRIKGSPVNEMKSNQETIETIILEQEGREDKLKKLEDRLRNNLKDKFDESLINHQSFSEMYDENYIESEVSQKNEEKEPRQEGPKSTETVNSVYKAEDYNEMVNERLEPYTKGLSGDEKEIAEVWAHLGCMDIEFDEQNEFNGSYINEILKVEENKYLVRNGDLSVEFVKNLETNEFEVKKYNHITDEKRYEDSKKYYKSINNAQITMQYEKYRIGQNLGIEINEITEIQDEKLSKYFLDQNGLFENDGMFMISYIDDEGKNNYKFVGWDEEIGGYKELSGLNQVPVTKNINYEMPGSDVTLMRPAEVQFCDINGKNIVMHHQMGTGDISLGYDKADFQKDGEGKIKTEDYGINKLLHNSRVVELFKAGYNALGVGIEEVKKIYNEFRGKENVNEKTNTTEEKGR